MKSNCELVFDLINENQNISNNEINDKLNIQDAKSYISKLVSRGFIEYDSSGDSRFNILTPYVDRRFTKPQTLKMEYYNEMIEMYMLDFRNADTFNDRVKVGRELRLLIERL
jgi:hypothetical protein